jgi:hypothetical protein
LEECFTLIELQSKEAEKNNDFEIIQQLDNIRYLLTAFLREVTSDFEEWGVCHSQAAKQFGRILYKEKPTIITFNYDFFIEKVIELASGQKQDSLDTRMKFEVNDEELGHSFWNWNRPLAYSIEFDDVMLYDGAEGNRQKFIRGERFYSHPNNKLYTDSYLLKLHGSLNWFRYLPFTPNQYMQEQQVKKAYEERKQRIILGEVAHPILAGYLPPNKDQLYIEPLIITPIIYKDVYLEDRELYGRVFAGLWKKAESSLRNCKRLAVIGYSFPATDFLTKKLFLESFVDTKLDELIIVSPDPLVISKATAC